MRNEDGAKADAKIVDYTTIIPPDGEVMLYIPGLCKNRGNHA